jgi:hypothetical protein
MILRSLSQQQERTAERPEAPKASEVFIETQKHVTAPYAIIFQAEHSQLAGQLAAALSENTFGEISPEVIQAAGQHDFGWQASDEGQIQSLGQKSPRPFPDLSVEETLPSWRNSVAYAASITPLIDVLVSRHFSLLGGGDPGRQGFVRDETERRQDIERALPCSRFDLDRWTAAVGFCDLLSLYLCSGSRQTVELPFAHPASPIAAQASKTTLSWVDGSPCFSSPILKPGTQVLLTVREYSGRGTDLRPLTLQWSFDRG